MDDKPGSIKASIRYIAHRPNKEGERETRELFDEYGNLSKAQAYQLITEAQKGTKFIRIVLSPDPKREDTQGDLSMRELTINTLNALQKRLKTPVQFIAALHDDHTDIRHVHIIALVNRTLSIRDFQAMRMAATSAALGQRKLLDQTQKRLLTRPIKPLQAAAKERGVVTPRHASRTGLRAPQAIHVQGGAMPPCPKAGMGEHTVATITPGLYWCRTCHEAIRDTHFTRSSKQSGHERALSL